MNMRGYLATAENLGFRKRDAIRLLALSLVATLFEGLGLGILLPVFQYVQADGQLANLVEGSSLWAHLVSAYQAVGLPITLATLLATSFLCILGRQAITYVRLVYMARVKEGLVADIRHRGFNAYLYARSDYHDQQRLGEIVNDLTTDLQRAISALFGSLMLAGYAILGVVYIAIMLALSAKMTLVTLVVGGLAALSLGRLFRQSAHTGRQVVDANQQMSSFLVERLRSTRLVRLSGTERAEAAAMARLAQRQRDTLVHIALLLARIEVVIEPLVIGLGFAFLYVGTTAFNLTLGEIGLFLIIILRLLPVMKEALRQRQSVLSTLGSLEAVDRRLREMRAAADRDSGEKAFTSLERDIHFDEVRFDYGRGVAVPALDGVSLTIPARSMTALVGPSGSGKSTLVDLLPRLREPNSGQILLDGTPIGQFSLRSLRRGISFVPQEAQVFNVSVTEHIRYGRADATMEEVQQAARLAGAAEFIEAFEQGYDTLLGENGSRLSGGQRQRLDLARALVRRAPILILDEPTSNLDAESEAAFREALARIREETPTTVIIIGHRLSTVAAADQIVVLDQGFVVEAGSHDALVASGDWYARAWRSQQVRATTLPQDAQQATTVRARGAT